MEREEIVSRLVEMMSTKRPSEYSRSIQKLREKHGEEEAEQLVSEAKEQIADKEKRRVSSQWDQALASFAKNDTGISRDTVAALEAKLREKCTSGDLGKGNAVLAAKARKLTYFEIALIAAIHRKSIREHNGQSPFARIKKLAAKCGLTDKPLDDRQIAFALMLLSVFGFTEKVENHVAPSFVDGKVVKGAAGRWELLNEEFWSER